MVSKEQIGHRQDRRKPGDNVRLLHGAINHLCRVTGGEVGARTLGEPQRERTIVCGAMHKLKGAVNAFFFPTADERRRSLSM
jgi:hypothetical protein